MLKEYFAVLGRQIKFIIGGACLSGIGFVITFAMWWYQSDPSSVRRLAWSSLAVLVLSVIPAQYCAWKEERIEREKVEAQLCSDANLQGIATVMIGGFNPFVDQDTPGAFLRFSVDAQNHGSECTIGSVLLMVAAPSGAFSPQFGFPIDIEPATIGKGQYFRWDSGTLKQRGISKDQLRASQFRVTLADGTGRTHFFLKTSVSPEILMRAI